MFACVFGKNKCIPRLIIITFVVFGSASFFVYKIHPNRTIENLVKKWGEKKYSQNNEELIIRDFFKDKKGGFFVDIGANHYKINSTTYCLEKTLNWHGIAVDALEQYKYDYEKFRPKTTYFTFFISDKSDAKTNFYTVLSNPRLSSNNYELLKHFKTAVSKIETITLNDLLSQQAVKQIDFMSIDIEMSELEALKGFNINIYKPKLVCIEVHQPIKEKIYKYFKDHHYKELKQYSRIDPLNAYFTPS